MNPLWSLAQFKMGPGKWDHRRLGLNYFKLGVVGIVSLLSITSTLSGPMKADAQTQSAISQSQSQREAQSVPEDLSTTVGTFVGSIAREWTFGSSDDPKSDGWPDDWTRKSGIGFPKFNRIAITRETTDQSDLDEIENLRRGISQLWIGWEQGKFPWLVTPEAAPPLLDIWLERTVLNSFLRMELDGNAAEVASPMLAIEPGFEYGMQCQCRFKGQALSDYKVWASLKLFDSNRTLVAEQRTEHHSLAHDWELLVSVDEETNATEVAFAQMTLNVHPTSRRSGPATVDFDSVKLLRYPKLDLTQNRSTGIYWEQEPIEITVTVNAFPEAHSFARLRITDHTGNLVHEERIESQDKAELQKKLTRSWTSDNLLPGYYKAQLEHFPHISSANSVKVQQFVILARQSERTNDRFGFVLTEIPILDGSSLVDSIRLLSASHLKVPVYGLSANINEPQSSAHVGSMDFAKTEGTAGLTLAPRELAERVEALQRMGFAVTGILGAIPEPDAQSLPLLQLLSNRIGQYQLGADSQTLLFQSPAIAEQLNTLKKSLLELNLNARFSQVIDPVDLRLPSALADRTSATTQNAPDYIQLDTQQLTAKQELTSDELRNLFSGADSNYWYSVTPLTEESYSPEVRVVDLLERMLLTTDPSIPTGAIGWVQLLQDSQRGLLSTHGQPTDMFVPFRNLAQTFSDAKSIGDLNDESLPPNQLIARENDLNLLIWGFEPTKIDMYLGKNIRVHDIWGRTIEYTEAMTPHGQKQMFIKDRYPVIVEGLDAPAIRWRRGLNLLTKSIAVKTSGDTIIEVEFHNSESAAVRGKLKLESSIFASQPSEVDLIVAEQSKQTISVPVRMSPFTTTGSQWIRLTSRIDQNDTPTYVSVDREILIGSAEIQSEADYFFDETGNLIVTLDLHNTRAPLGQFDCYVTAPGRTRKRAQFTSDGAHSQQKFVFASPRDLIGKTIWIQVEQLSQNLIINERVLIESPTTSD